MLAAKQRPSAYLQTKLTRPLVTKDGGTLRTVLDARAYMLRLSKDRERSTRRQKGGPITPCEGRCRRCQQATLARHTHSNAVLALRGRVAWAHDWVSDPTLTPLFQTLPGRRSIARAAMERQMAANEQPRKRAST